MKKSLTMKETIIVASTLFGMLFGAGNMIFPVHLGQLAGSNSWPAIVGFIITAVGIPVLSVAALGKTHSNSLQDLSGKVASWYGVVFTVVLYLTIGPLFAIPRTCTVSFTIGVAPMISESAYTIGQLIFSIVFFAVVLYFSLKPSGITTWIGKWINPIFLIFLAIMIITALVNPIAHISEVEPVEAYQDGAFFNGFIEGYGTMDVIASLAFGIVIIDAVRRLGVENDDDVAASTIKSGIFAALLMAVIYILSILMGAESRGLFEVSANGGIALTEIAHHYFGGVGSIILAITITFACLKTAIGLITSCGEMFGKMFPNSLSYKGWVILFTLTSLALANVGLTAIIEYSVPVLMLLYPLVIVLVIAALFEKFFNKSKYVYQWLTIGAFIPAVFDFLKTLPAGLQSNLNIPAITEFASKVFPLFDMGLGWIVPSIIGLVIGLVITFAKQKKTA